MIRTVLSAAFLLLMVAGANADTIELRRSVRLEASRKLLTLSDVALLEGPEALALADVVIFRIQDLSGVSTVPLERIRAELDAAGVHWANVHLSGRDVVVRPPSTGTAPPRAMQPVSIGAARESDADSASTEARRLLAADLIDEPTVRGAIARRIVAALGAEAESVRLQILEEDQDVLATQIGGHGVEIQPRSTYAGDRVEVAVRFWSEGRLLREETVRVEPSLLCRVSSATCDLSREEVVNESDLATIEQWLPPSQAAPLASREIIVGQIASRPMRRGEIFRKRDLSTAKAIHRGDRVLIRCLAGGIAITFHAEARSDGAAGEQIEFRKIGERDSFFATVVSAGEAMIEVTQ